MVRLPSTRDVTDKVACLDITVSDSWLRSITGRPIDANGSGPSGEANGRTSSFQASESRPNAWRTKHQEGSKARTAKLYTRPTTALASPGDRSRSSREPRPTQPGMRSRHGVSAERVGSTVRQTKISVGAQVKLQITAATGGL
jgi:hypothetical protein